jgi:glycosyltransferase involved in cell wall biosynthesis
MKITCIASSQVPSTTANSIQVMKVCQSLADLGNQVTLLVPGQTATPWQELAFHYGLGGHKAHLSVEWLPAHPRLKRYDFALAAVKKAQSIGADLVYAWPPQAALIALQLKMPVVLELHGEPEGRLGPAVFRLLLRKSGSKRFLPISRALALHLEYLYGYNFTTAELVVSPNGVDLERYQNLPEPIEARRRLGLADGLTVGFTGHMYPGRGMGLLFELSRCFPQIRFLWVGGRPEDVDAWQRRSASEGVTNITLAGFVENERLPLYQAAADILLMPYERQISGSSGGNSAAFCSPMKMFEYMACGRAIISSDLPVIREVLNEKNSVLAEPGDLTAWKDALSKLSSSSELRQRLGDQAYTDIQSYTWVARSSRALIGFPKEG